ncbi:MAG: hypothetical protein DMG13_00450 [Acidobacteria bacterium]|nr:MAG: hypothetical protein DMG13_00450 [Acidobacteriota bacterium]
MDSVDPIRICSGSLIALLVSESFGYRTWLEGKGQTMALKKLRMICAGGDKTLAEWDTETVSPQRLAEIEKEFNDKVVQGWFAADISDKRNVLIREFDPDAEILLIPRVQGGL